MLTFCLIVLTATIALYSCGHEARANLTSPVQTPAEEIKSEKPDTAHTTTERSFGKEELLGKLNPAKDSGFIRIDLKYTKKPDIYLRKATYEAYKKMYEKASKQGIVLNILSATRNFDAQKMIWENKWKDAKYKDLAPNQRAEAIMKFSSMPGTSRHHWGTDIDLNNLSPTYFESGEGKRIYDWLLTNAADFGFYQTYTSKKSGRTGYEEEKWHWTYLPLSREFLKQYNEKIKYSDISGFSGSSTASFVRAIEHYVNGIDPALTK